jgi:hypothetical protein
MIDVLEVEQRTIIENQPDVADGEPSRAIRSRASS